MLSSKFSLLQGSVFFSIICFYCFMSSINSVRPSFLTFPVSVFLYLIVYLFMFLIFGVNCILCLCFPLFLFMCSLCSYFSPFISFYLFSYISVICIFSIPHSCFLKISFTPLLFSTCDFCIGLLRYNSYFSSPFLSHLFISFHTSHFLRILTHLLS